MEMWKQIKPFSKANLKVRGHCNMVSILKIETHLLANEGETWGVCSEFQLWSLS